MTVASIGENSNWKSHKRRQKFNSSKGDGKISEETNLGGGINLGKCRSSRQKGEKAQVERPILETGSRLKV